MGVNGFLLVDKAAGMTSHDVVAIARRALGTRKVGHAGTLDPMATGLLVLGFGSGTRLLQYVTDGKKAYEARIVLGASTVTDDVEGEILQRATPAALAAITDEEIEVTLAKMIGVISQRPSSVSAVKVGGKRAYDRVRAGEEVKLEPRNVTIYRLDLKKIRRSEAKIEIDISVLCGSGTFIRAIARDCGDSLGVGGHLNSLRRTLVAPFEVTKANSIEDVKNGNFSVHSIEDVAQLRFPIRDVTLEENTELRFGRTLSPNLSEEITAALYQKRLVSLLKNKSEKAHPIAVFVNEANM